MAGALAWVPGAHAQGAGALEARYEELREPLARNQFQRPLYLESGEESGHLKGDIYARVDQPFSRVGPSLSQMDQWCELLSVHQNVKGCAVAGDELKLNIGRKFDQPLAEAQEFGFRFSAAPPSPDYLRVALQADEGPLGTREYRIALEAVALDERSTFLHFSYSYATSAASRLATRLYLATSGRSKVGFSIVDRADDGEPVYISSVRGIVERNAMRFYLAVEAYLGALSVPEPERYEKRINDWYAAVERYPRQLHELERDEYIGMKRKEAARAAAAGSDAQG